MKILFLAHRIPYPPNKGDKIRSFNEIKYLSNSHEIDLVCLADNSADVQFQKDLKKYCRKVFVHCLHSAWAKIKGTVYLASGKAISVGYFYLRKVQQTVDRRLEQTDYDAIICFSSPMAEYVFRSKGFWSRKVQGTGYKVQGQKKRIFANLGPCTLHRKPVLVMDFCDVDSDKWAQYGTLTSFPKSFIYTLENHRLAKYEKKIAEHFDHSVFVSQKEAEIFLNLNPHLTNISVIPNGVDYNYFAPQERHKAQSSGQKKISRKTMRLQPNIKSEIRNPKSEISPMPHAPCPMLLFTGAMDYYANVDGVKWFCDNIYPEIQINFPNTEFHIVGSNPNANVKALQNNNGVKVTGFVENTRLFYEKAYICVIPLRMARGIQNKVLEAMSMEKAVITTSQAIQGITAVNGEHLVVADEPKEFAQSVVTLLKDKDRRFTLGKNARRFVKTNYNWQTNMEKLEELLNTSS